MKKQAVDSGGLMLSEYIGSRGQKRAHIRLNRRCWFRRKRMRRFVGIFEILSVLATVFALAIKVFNVLQLFVKYQKLCTIYRAIGKHKVRNLCMRCSFKTK
jgi:hypothetical protein